MTSRRYIKILPIGLAVIAVAIAATIDSCQFFSKKQTDDTVLAKTNSAVLTMRQVAKLIPDNVKEKLFHENITTKPVGEGTGLGMQITHDIIVNNHHGEILIDTAVGEGTKVTFVIPASKI